MFEEFFQKYEIRDPEKITKAQSKKINAALQKKLAADNSQPQHSYKEKENDIMKTKSIRTIIIAAAVAVIGAVSVGATGILLTREEIAADLAEKNGFTPEFAEVVAEVESRNKPNEEPNQPGYGYIVAPSYEDMVINELAVREVIDKDLKGWEEYLPGIILQHIQPGGGIEFMIKPDGNGGYLNICTDEPITDEKLLDAIAEGTEKYGDTFVIMY